MKQPKEHNDLEAMRHSCEHVLTMAMVKMYPGLKAAMGPATTEGFYFDFDFDGKIQEKDFEKIEKEMQTLIKQNLPFVKQEVTVEEARKIFEGNEYKLEWVDAIEKKGEKVSVYWIGEPGSKGSWVDLCSGPHVSSTGDIGAFKLLSIAGAYWHGDEKNKMLTRIYATAYPTKDELDKHLWQLEEAEKRNHRKIGQEMELFAIFPEIGQGLPVWLPNGFIIRRVLEDYMLEAERKLGYKHAITPVLNKAELFETSGHLGFYKDSMYPPIEVDNEKLYLKPMSCPGAMMIYKHKTRSYRDLPYKLGEFGLVYRYEQSGELHGLQRVRGFTQNDAHIFCRENQLEDEITEVIVFLKQFFKDLGFDNYWMRLSLSDSKDKKYDIASRKEWEKAEKTLKKVLDDNKLEYKVAPGEAAFYGPKIDIQAVNVFGKEDSISTIQVDFNLPRRFELVFIDSEGKEERPYVIHRALIGSFERFFAFLIEHYGGAFPAWLAPIQAVVLPISDRNLEYAKKVEQRLLQEKIRVEVDGRSETLQAKIRDAQLKKVPYMLVIGGREEENGTVALRLRNGPASPAKRGEKDLGAVKLDDFVTQAKRAIEEKLELW